MADDTPTGETPEEQPASEEQHASEEQAASEEQQPTPEEAAAGTSVPQPDDVAEEQASDDLGVADEAPAEAPAAEAEAEDEEPETPREKPAIPGADLEVDLVLDSEERAAGEYGYGEEGEDGDGDSEEPDVVEDTPVTATIDLAADARYRATGKRKTSVARVILKPGTGAYTVNGKELDTFFPRATLQRQIRQPLEAVGYEDRMDVVARLHGGGVSAQAGALRHGISRALIEADPNLRGELKRRGFLTRDARVKERKKAGLKKARKRPQFSKR